MQLLLTSFYLIWLCAVLVFLFLIWRTTHRYIKEMEGTVIEASRISAEAARRAAETAEKLAEMLVEKGQHA